MTSKSHSELDKPMESSWKALGYSVLHDAYECLFTQHLQLCNCHHSCLYHGDTTCRNLDRQHRESIKEREDDEQRCAAKMLQGKFGEISITNHRETQLQKEVFQREQQSWLNQLERCSKTGNWASCVRLGFENKRATMVSEQARRRKLNRSEGREWKNKGVSEGSAHIWAEGEVNKNSSVQEGN